MPEPTKPALCLAALLACAAMLGGCAKMPGAYDYVTEAKHAPVAPDASRGRWPDRSVTSSGCG